MRGFFRDGCPPEDEFPGCHTGGRQYAPLAEVFEDLVKMIFTTLLLGPDRKNGDRTGTKWDANQ